MALTRISSEGIKNLEIKNEDINASAAIDLSKLATGLLPSGITVGGSNILAASIQDSDVHASAAIALSKLATGTLPSGLKVNHNNLQTGIIEDENISSSAAIQGSKISPSFTSDLTITDVSPAINFTDSNNDSDFKIIVNDGKIKIQDTTNSNAVRFFVDSSGTVDVAGNLDVGSGLDVTGAITSTGNLTTNGDLTIQSANPILFFNDTGANPDYHIKNNNGYFDIVDGTNVATRLSISNTGELTVAGNSNFGAGIDVTGDITVTGTVDGRDLQTDGTKLDGIESNATADMSASEILNLIKTVDGAGSGLSADLLDGVEGSGYIRSGTSDTATGALTLSGGISTDSKDVYTNNGTFMANDADGAFADRTGSNIDHIWHDESNNAWNFCSDTTYKNTGNSVINAGGISLPNQSGSVTDVNGTNRIKLGDDDVLQLAGSGGVAMITSFGNSGLYIRNAGTSGSNKCIYMYVNDTNLAFYAKQDAEVKLYNNGSERIKTESFGMTVTGFVKQTDTVAFYGEQDSHHDVANATWTVVKNLGTNAINTDGWNESTGIFTVPTGKGGIYQFHCGAGIDDIQRVDIVRVSIKVNSSVISVFGQQRVYYQSSSAPSNQIIGATASFMHELNDGDDVSCVVYHNEGTTEKTEPNRCWFGAHRC